MNVARLYSNPHPTQLHTVTGIVLINVYKRFFLLKRIFTFLLSILNVFYCRSSAIRMGRATLGLASLLCFFRDIIHILRLG